MASSPRLNFEGDYAELWLKAMVEYMFEWAVNAVM
jgi:hypothetical protein